MRGVLGIIQKGDLYLLGTEAKRDRPYYGMKRLIGGGIKDRERSYEAIVREVYEETQLVVFPRRKILETVGVFASIPIDVYLCHWLTGEPIPKKDEIDNLSWMTMQEIMLCRHDIEKVSRVALEQYVLYLERNPHRRQS